MRTTILSIAVAIALSAASIAFGQFADDQPSSTIDDVLDGSSDSPRRHVLCCVASGDCSSAASQHECNERILEANQRRTGMEGLDEPETVHLALGDLEAGQRVAPALDTMEVQVLGCDDLASEAAPVPEGAIILSQVRWFACVVDFVDSCLQTSQEVVAWPRYSDSHLGASRGHRDPVVGSKFRVRLEAREDWMRVRGAEEIDRFGGGSCVP